MLKAETPILWPPDVKNWLMGLELDAGSDWRQEKVMTEDEMVGWYHQLNGHGFGLTPGVGDKQGGLACCSSLGYKESDTTERLNWTELNFSISPSNEFSGLIFFRIDWLDLLAVRGTLQSLIQHHSSRASTLCRSPFFMVQLSHPYMTTGKTIALTIWTFVGKVSAFQYSLCCCCCYCYSCC